MASLLKKVRRAEVTGFGRWGSQPDSPPCSAGGGTGAGRAGRGRSVCCARGGGRQLGAGGCERPVAGWRPAFPRGLVALLFLGAVGSFTRPESRFVFEQTTGLVGLAVSETPHEVGASLLALSRVPKDVCHPATLSPERLMQRGHPSPDDNSSGAPATSAPSTLWIRCHNRFP